MVGFLACVRIIALATCIVSAGAGVWAGGKGYRDSDWNLTLLDNCGLPVPDRAGTAERPASIRWHAEQGDRKLVFRLDPGDMGKCSSDRKARHGAAYWERAKLRQAGSLALDTVHDIRFRARLAEGFVNDRESFFQIHGWTQDCNVPPMVMLQMRGGLLRVRVLRGVIENGSSLGDYPYRGDLVAVAIPAVSVADLAGAERAFQIRISIADGRGFVSVWLDDAELVTAAPLSYQSCVVPRIKVGIYRPAGSNNRRSVLFLDELTVQSVSKATLPGH